MSSDASESTLQFDLLAWFELNRKRIVLGIVFVVVAIAVMLWMRWRSTEAEASASAEVLKASGAFTPNNLTSVVSSATLLQLASRHHGTEAAERALLLAAGRLFAEGKFAEAHAQFEAFKQQQPESPFTPTAMLGAASSLDAQGKNAEATAAYQELITRFPAEAVANQARLAKARLHEAMNQPEQALALYDEIVKSGVFTPTVQEAGGRREALLARNPSLVKPAPGTNALNAVPGLTPLTPAAPAPVPVPPGK